MGKWKMTRLGNICAVNAGQGAPQGENSYGTWGTPFVKAGNLFALVNGKKESEIQHVDESIAKKYKLKLFGKGTIVFAKSGMSCIKGHVYVLKEDCYIVNHLACIFSTKVNTNYLRYYFTLFKPNLLIKDSAYPSISLSDIRNLKILLPPPATQEKIAMILDKVGELIEKRKAQIAKLDLLVKSQFVEMFGDPVSNPMGWDKLLWQKVFNTTTGKLDSNAMVTGGQFPFFTCAKEQYWINEYAFDCEALLLAGNNAAGIYDVKYYKGKFNAYQRTYVLTLLNKEYSYFLFKYQLENKLMLLRDRSKGTNTRYLTMGILGELDFVAPPPALQTEFATFVEQVKAQKKLLRQSLEKLEHNYKSLMQKCFRREIFE